MLPAVAASCFYAPYYFFSVFLLLLLPLLLPLFVHYTGVPIVCVRWSVSVFVSIVSGSLILQVSIAVYLLWSIATPVLGVWVIDSGKRNNSNKNLYQYRFSHRRFMCVGMGSNPNIGAERPHLTAWAKSQLNKPNHVFLLYIYVWLPWMRFFRAFSSVVRQMLG
jgi:hypothetical protein